VIDPKRTDYEVAMESDRIEQLELRIAELIKERDEYESELNRYKEKFGLRDIEWGFECAHCGKECEPNYGEKGVVLLAKVLD
jgi:hypothetical protein